MFVLLRRRPKHRAGLAPAAVSLCCYGASAAVSAALRCTAELWLSPLGVLLREGE